MGPDEALSCDPGSVERSLAFMGLAGLEDPPRPGVPGAIATLKRAGVQVLMLTGDHPATPRATASRVDIDAYRMVRGRELEGLPEAQLRELIAMPSIPDEETSPTTPRLSG